MASEIKTGFLAVSVTSFNFSIPGCDYKNIFKNSYLQNISLGEEEKAWKLVPTLIYSTGLFICLKMQYLTHGTWSLCFGDGITAEKLSLPDSFVHFWSPGTVYSWDQANMRKPIKGSLGPGQFRNSPALLVS